MPTVIVCYGFSVLTSSIPILLCIGLLSFSPAHARQEKPTAHLTIHVDDISGAFVPRAHIELIDLSTSPSRKLETDYKGDLSIDLPLGSYDLTASQEGFKPAKKRINVQDNTDQTIKLILELPDKLQSESAITPPSQDPDKRPYTITISTSPRASVGSEVKLHITTKNTSDGTIYHIVRAGGPPGRNLDISVRDSKGNPVQETEHGRKIHGTDPNREPWSGSVFTGRYPLKPGDVLEEELNLAEEYDFSKPGKYSVQVLRSDITTDGEIKSRSTSPLAVVKSNTITLTLVR